MSKAEIINIYLVEPGKIEKNEFLSKKQKLWLKKVEFSARTGQLTPLCNEKGEFDGYIFGLGEQKNRSPLIMGLASAKLADGRYKLIGNIENPTLYALGFNLGAYKFSKYKDNGKKIELIFPKGTDEAEVRRLSEAAFIARDLINEGANILGPNEFEKRVRQFAKQNKMEVNSIVGEDLIKQNFPLIYAVGRAGEQAPRLLDLRWGDKNHPKVTLVGKGVTFDSGGLGIKPAGGMILMKKDMGGAANVLGLAHAIIDAKLRVNLRILLPIVENSISAGAFRPGDILSSRGGKTIEIGHTDAEGRLILADALAFGDEEKPDLLINIATLTGAARIALGPDLPALYSDDEELVRNLQKYAQYWGDPLWHMPLWPAYEERLSSDIADLNNITAGFNFAGSISAALFLKKFIKKAKSFAHLDIFAWSINASAGRPKGGTDQGIRANYQLIKDKYGAA